MKEFTGYIYRINNKLNSEFYIGRTTTSINKRFVNHRYEARRNKIQCEIYRAMRKYGTENFEAVEVETINASSKGELSDKLDELEIYYIYTLNPEYNSAPGGLGHTGVTWSDERREKFKELMSGENNPCFGKPKSDETREKLSKALKGRVIHEESRKKISETMKGVPKSDETRNKMKEAAKNRTNKPPSGKEHHNSKCVDQYDLKGNLIKTFDSIHHAAKELSIQPGGICMCCKGKLKTSGGYVFKYNELI
jgi:group I intron endonuclease